MTEIKAIHPAVRVLLMTDIRCEYCCKSGAADYTSLSTEEVLLVINNALHSDNKN
jgi:hypothetical protein